MINVAILEHEKESKEIIFQLGNILRKVPWTFRHYYKASELAKAAKEEDYQIFIFDEMFRTPRFESVFVHDHPAALIIYVCADPHSLQAEEERERVLYISKNRLIPDLQEIADKIQSQARQEEIYPLSCHGVKVELPINEIYYLEKQGKNVYFHTAKGVFHRRLFLVDLEEFFEPYGFIRVHVSYLVNRKYITAVSRNEVTINNSVTVPLSRQHKRRLGMQVRQKSEAASEDEELLES